MALITRHDLMVKLTDVLAGIDVTQTKRVDDNSLNLVKVDDTYVLGASQMAFQQLSVGDVDTMFSATIVVIAKGTSFLGVDVGFGSSDPGSGSFTVKDIFCFTGELSNSGIWVKNLDDQSCTIQVIVTGASAS